MEDNKLDYLRPSFIFMSSVVGGGFASGQEIFQFFSKYYHLGIKGVFLSGIIFTIFGALFLEFIFTNKISSFKTLFNKFFKNKTANILEILAVIIQFICFSIIIAGLSGLIQQKFSINIQCSSIITFFILYLSLIYGDIIYFKFGGIISPLVFFGVIIGGSFVLINNYLPCFDTESIYRGFSDNWISSSLLYCGYNFFFALPILFKTGEIIKTKDHSIKSGLFGGILVFICLIIVFFTMYFNYENFDASKFPMVQLIFDYEKTLGEIYLWVIIAAMYFSGFAIGSSLNKSVEGYFKINSSLRIFIMLIISYLISLIGFAELIAKIFPIVGVIGIILMLNCIIAKFSIKK